MTMCSTLYEVAQGATAAVVGGDRVIQTDVSATPFSSQHCTKPPHQSIRFLESTECSRATLYGLPNPWRTRLPPTTIHHPHFSDSNY
jgi:hypothetical protein